MLAWIWPSLGASASALLASSEAGASADSSATSLLGLSVSVKLADDAEDWSVLLVS